MQALWRGARSYTGLDVDRRAIDWARRYLARRGQVRFEHLDVASARYHPKGQLASTAVRLPLRDEHVDIVTLLSVFSHMFLAEIAAYLQEVRRILAPGGRVYLTVFVEDGVPDEVENPDGYLNAWKGPVHCVRLNRAVFEALAAERGFLIDTFAYREMASGQSIYVLKREN